MVMSAMLSARPTKARRNFFGMPIKPPPAADAGAVAGPASLCFASNLPSCSAGTNASFGSRSAGEDAESTMGDTPGTSACNGFPWQKRYTNSPETAAKTVIAPAGAESVVMSVLALGCRTQLKADTAKHDIAALRERSVDGEGKQTWMGSPSRCRIAPSS
jgi:hypothetical protein